MLFNSFKFLIFFPITALIYYFMPQKYRHYFLLVASYYFYMSWNPALVFLILFSTVITYFAGRIIKNTVNKKMQKLWVAVSFVVCFGVLIFFKYYNFLSGTVSEIIGIFSGNSPNFAMALILPVGISFYTFQTLSYVIDVYAGKIEAEYNFVYFALFVSFFPQLVAGPIERPENLLPQLHASEKPSFCEVRDGVYLMAAGFFKKLAVADMIAPYVNQVFNNPENAVGPQVALASVMFAAQIYCDFSGYTDIATGCAKVMGIHLMKNFDSPYMAYGIRDFWKRWHISLTSWFRDYLYFPLGGSRCGTYRHLLNIMIVFVVSGLWHGASWTFVIWGLLHGFYQVIEVIIDKSSKNTTHYPPIGINRIIRTAITFTLVCFAWIFFRANSVSDLMILLTALFSKWSFSEIFTLMGIDLIGALSVAVSIFVLFRIDGGALTQEKAGKRSLVATSVCIVWVVAISWLTLLQGDGASSFIYFQF